MCIGGSTEGKPRGKPDLSEYTASQPRRAKQLNCTMTMTRRLLGICQSVRFYISHKNTFLFTVTLTSNVTCTTYLLLEYNNLPQPARHVKGTKNINFLASVQHLACACASGNSPTLFGLRSSPQICDIRVTFRELFAEIPLRNGTYFLASYNTHTHTRLTGSQ